MAKKPEDLVEKAKALYSQGIKIAEISKILGIQPGTLRSWKSRYKWDKEIREKRCNGNVAKRCNVASGKQVPEGIIQEAVCGEDVGAGLTSKQEMFCCFYVMSFNAAKAYKKAYGVDYKTACAAGSRMLRNVNIKNEIAKLKQNRLNREMLSEDDIFQKYMDIAFADITDFVEFGQQDIPVMGAFGPVKVKNEKTGEEEMLMKRVNTVRFRESSEVDGTLVSEVRQGKDGASIKLADRMKALQWLSDHIGLATNSEKAVIEYTRARTMRLTGEGMETEDTEEIEAEIYGTEKDNKI